MNKVRLNIDKISPGMKLAEPITTPAGITLMPAGIRLTPMFIARIKKWNVTELDVFVDVKPSDNSALVVKTESRKAVPPESKSSAPKPAPLAQTPERGKKLTAQEAEFARMTAMEVSRPFVNVKDNNVMMQLRIAVIKQLVLNGPNSAINVLRRQCLGTGEQEVG